MAPSSPSSPAAPAPAKLSDLVYAKILGRIRTGDYPPNAKLPTEHALAEALSVSRPVIRDALARLRADGLVSSRRGSGTYVVATREVGAPAPSPALTSIADLRRCMLFRVSLEGEAAWHAAQAADAEQREPLVRAMIQIESDLTQGRSASPQTDLDFHLAIAQATGNRFFVAAMSDLQGSVMTAMGLTPSFDAAAPVTRTRTILEEHRAIYDAIMGDDPPAAREAMRRHLERAMKRIFEGAD